MSNIAIIKKKGNSKYYVIFFLLIMLAISHCLKLGTLSLIIALGILIFAVLFNVEENYINLFICLPFFNLMNKNIGSTSLFYILVVIFIWKFLHSRNMKVNKNKLLWIFGLFFLRISSFDFILLIKWMLLIMPLILTYNDEIFYKNLGKLVKAISLSTIISSIFGYYMLLKGLSIYTRSYVYSSGVVTTRFAGMIGDSVVYGQFILVIIASNLVISYFNQKERKANLIYSIILAFLGLLTYSKTYLLLLFIIFSIYMASIINKNFKDRRTVIISFVLIGISVIMVCIGVKYVLDNLDNPIINNYMIRFKSLHLWTGRDIIFQHYIELLKNNWTTLFFAMNQEIYSMPFRISSSLLIKRAHNIYIETVCMFGLTGTIFIFSWIIYKIVLFTKGKPSWICFCPLLVLLISGISLHGHLEFQYYFTVSLALNFISLKSIEALKMNDNNNDNNIEGIRIDYDKKSRNSYVS